MNIIAPDSRIETLITDSLGYFDRRVSALRLSELTENDWQSFLSLAAMMKVQGLLFHRLKSQDLEHTVPSEIMLVLQKAYWNTAQRNLILTGALKQIVSAFHDEGIDVIALKGIYMANAVYKSLGHRQMADIDLMIKPNQLEQAAKMLQAQGFAPQTTYSLPVSMNAQHHLPPFFRADVAQVELHWNIVQPYQRNTIDPTEIWDRSRAIRIAGIELFGLGNEDCLLHTCYHLAYHHLFAFGLRPLCDITHLVNQNNGEIDWRGLVERARRWRWQQGVYLALRLSKECLGAEIPGEILYELRPQALGEEMLIIAKSQVLSDPEMASALSPRFVQLWHERSGRSKISTILNSVFLPKTLIANNYGVAPNSLKLYPYYLVRLADMLTRYRGATYGLLRKRPAISSTSYRKAAILAWLADNEEPDLPN